MRAGHSDVALLFSHKCAASMEDGSHGLNARAFQKIRDPSSAFQSFRTRKLDIRLYQEKGIQTPIARGRSTPHLDDKVNLDHQVANQELSLSERSRALRLIFGNWRYFSRRNAWRRWMMARKSRTPELFRYFEIFPERSRTFQSFALWKF